MIETGNITDSTLVATVQRIKETNEVTDLILEIDNLVGFVGEHVGLS